jgi:hypothetical protein
MASASDLDRIEACPGSEALPHIGEISLEGEKGTRKHSFIADVAAYGFEEAVARAPEESRDVYAATEVAYAWDPPADTARELGRNIDRQYAQHGRKPYELAGTVDAVAVAGTRLIVGDWKSGRSRVRPAALNRQLHYAVVAAARALEAIGVVITEAVGFIGYAPDAGRPVFDVAPTWNTMGIDRLAGELQDILGTAAALKLEDVRPEHLRVGPQCRYCPAFRHCPAQRAMLRLYADDAPPVAFPAETQPEHVANAWVARQLIEKRLEQLDQAIETYVEQRGEVALPDGRVLKIAPGRPTYRYDAPATQLLLSTKYGPEVAARAIEPSTTGPKIEDALRWWLSAGGGKGKITHLKRETDDALTRIGARVRTQKMGVRAVAPGKVGAEQAPAQLEQQAGGEAAAS